MRARRAALSVLALWVTGYSPVEATIQVATNHWLTVKMDDDPGAFGRIGLFTIETGDWQAFAPKSIFYDSVNNSLGTSFITVRDDAAGIMWVNTDWSRVPAADSVTPYDGYTVMRMNSQTVGQAAIPGGFSTTYTLPNLTVIQEVAVIGSTSFNSSVRHTVTVTNTSGITRTIGVRYLWDWMVAAIDASWFRPRDPNGPYSDVFTETVAPAFQKYEVADSPTLPSFQIFGTVGGGSLLLPPTPPEELRYAAWPVASKAPWYFTTTGSGDDSAIVYTWGGKTPVSLAPGASATFTQYVTTRLDALTRGVPSVSLKISNTGYVCGGDALVYTLGWNNIGDGTINDLALTLTLCGGAPSGGGGLAFLPGSRNLWSSPAPAGPAAVSASAWSTALTGPWTNGEEPATGPGLFLRWVVDHVVPGQSGELRFIANVKPGLTFGTRNEAGLTATLNYDSSQFTATSPGSLNIAVTIAKIAVPSAVNAGDTVRYKLWIQTACTTTIYNLVVFDSIPAGATNLVPLSGGALSGTTMVTWTIPAIAPGATRWLEFEVTMTGATAVVRNTAYLDYDALKNASFEHQIQVASNQSQVDVHIPQLLFRKFVDKNPAPRRGQIMFTLDVINEFTATLTGLTLWDSLPPGMAFANASGGGIWSAADNRVDWVLPNVAPTANTHVFLWVTLSGTCWDLGPNDAFLGFTPGVPFPTSPRGVGSALIELERPLLDVSQWTVTDPVVQSGAVTYHLFLHNLGGDSAEAIVAWDSVPPRTSFVAADPSPAVQWPGPPRILEWHIAEMSPGATLDLTFTVSVDGDPAPIGPSRLWTTYGEVEPCARMSATTGDLDVTKARPQLTMNYVRRDQTQAVGGPVSWTLSVTNVGTDTACGVVAASTVPVGTIFGWCTGPPGWTCSVAGTDVVWNAGTQRIDTGDIAVLAYTVTVTGPTVAACQNILGAAAYRDRANVGFACPSCTDACLTIGDAQLGIVKGASQPDIGEGGPLTYSILVMSQGGLPAVQVSVWDTLPAGAVFGSCSGAPCLAVATASATIVTWSLPDQAPGASTTVFLYVTATAAMRSSCSNYAEARYSNPLPYLRPDAASNPVCVSVVQPVFDLAFAPGKPGYANGEPVIYTITWTNTGSGDALKVELIDSLAPDALFGGCTTATGGGLCSYNPVTRELKWSLGTVHPGESGTATVTLIPADTTPVPCGDDRDFINRVTIKYENSGGQTFTPPLRTGAPPAVHVSDSFLALSLTTTAECVTPGQEVPFTLNYTNACAETLLNISLWDSLPAGFAYGSVAGGATAWFDGAKLFWRLPPVPPGTTGSIFFTLTVTSSAVDPVALRANYTNAATLWQATEQTNAIDLACINVPRLSVRKTATPVAGPSPGPVGFTITVENITDFSAYAVEVTDGLPAPMRLATAQGTTISTATAAVWRLGTIEPHGTRILALTGVARDSAQDYPALINTAVARGRTGANFPLADAAGTAGFSLTAVPGIHPHPNPVDLTRGEKARFTGLDPGAIVRFYTLTGVKIMALPPAIGHTAEWDGRNRAGVQVAAGMYLYSIETPDGAGGRTFRKGKLGVIR